MTRLILGQIVASVVSRAGSVSVPCFAAHSTVFAVLSRAAAAPARSARAHAHDEAGPVWVNERPSVAVQVWW